MSPDPVKIHIVMLLSNPFRPDPRVEREATALVEAGYQVTVICWDRKADLLPNENHRGVEIVRIHNVPSAYGSGWRQLFYTPRFWLEAARRAVQLKPDVVHCHDLDTLYAGRLVKDRLGCKLIYDAHEDYASQMSLYLPGWLVRLLAWLERRLLTKVDSIFTASTVTAEKMRSHGQKMVFTVGNYQDLEAYDTFTDNDISEAKIALGLALDDYVVGYIGGFTRNRLILPLIEAAGNLPEVTILLWGDGHQRRLIESASEKYSNIQYLGWLPAEQVPLYMKVLDVVYYCLIPDFPGSSFNAPNTLSHAMAAGKPLIANEIGDLGHIIRQTGCGLLVQSPTTETIRKAVLDLRDPNLRRKFGQAGRAAAEERYNWGSAKQLLLQVYQNLV